MEMSQSIHYILPEALDPLCNNNNTNEHIDEGSHTIRCMSDAVSSFNQKVGQGVETNSPMPEPEIANNDAIMVDWFAGWALTQLENFRKFHVIMAPCVGGVPYERLRKDWMRKWGHVSDFYSPPSQVPSLTFPLVCELIKSFHFPRKKSAFLYIPS